MTPQLQAHGITVRFGGVTANDDVEIEVGAGELVGVIGPNGAGKTTFIDAITGFVPAQGSIVLDGTDLAALPAARRSRAGLVRTWQSIELFDDLSVEDNLTVAGERPTRFDLLRDVLGRARRASTDAVDAALGRVGLSDIASAFPQELSHGQRKLVGVARALMTHPRVLCLDEPAAGLDEVESTTLGRQLRSLADGGLTMILVDHDMHLVLGICDRIYVMDAGRIIASGTPTEIRHDPIVREAYLGTSLEEASP